MIYAKCGAVLLVVLLLFGGGYYFGGLSSKTKLEAFQASQAQNTATAVLAERASTAAELARVNAILKEYDNAQLDPIVPGVATRVLERACPAGDPLPAASTHTLGTVSPSPQPRGDSGSERLLQAVFDACAQDAAELTALQAAWPQ